MRDRRQRPHNPLDLDLEEFDRLEEEELIRMEDLEESHPDYENLSYGSRRRKPHIDPYS